MINPYPRIVVDSGEGDEHCASLVRIVGYEVVGALMLIRRMRALRLSALRMLSELQRPMGLSSSADYALRAFPPYGWRYFGTPK